LLMLCGVGFSLWLAELTGFQAQATADTPAEIPATVLKVFAPLLFLPLGILLWWPVFYTNQRIYGRPQSLTGGEWLWGVSWLLAVGLTSWILWQALGTPPEALAPTDPAARAEIKRFLFVGYAVT